MLNQYNYDFYVPKCLEFVYFVAHHFFVGYCWIELALIFCYMLFTASRF